MPLPDISFPANLKPYILRQYKFSRLAVKWNSYENGVCHDCKWICFIRLTCSVGKCRKIVSKICSNSVADNRAYFSVRCKFCLYFKCKSKWHAISKNRFITFCVTYEVQETYIKTDCNVKETLNKSYWGFFSVNLEWMFYLKKYLKGYWLFFLKS